MSLFTGGKLFKKAGEGSGGGGSDQHNLGWYATQAALEEAHPTATAGDWAIVGSTDTVWIWDTDNEEWVDSDQKGQVTSVNGQTGDVVLDLLPSQTGNAGKFLTTDGTDASWSNKPLVNKATSTGGLGILNQLMVGSYATAVGYNSSSAQEGGVAIGYQAHAKQKYGIAIGCSVWANAAHAIQIGNQSEQSGTTINSDANTFKVANQNGNFEIMSANGTIPTARITKVNSTITLTAAGWSNGSQTVNVTGMTATGVVLVSPDPTDQADYTSAGILCTAQAAGTLTFSCDSVPSGDIDVNVVML